jgi:alanyl-tRNA synthetase
VTNVPAGSELTRRVYLEDPAARNFVARVRAAGARDGRPAVLLAETCFYPAGGGQPADHGAIGEAAVVDVVEDESGEIWHLLDRPLSLGDHPAAVDAERRRDHTQQHSGQHLLSRCLTNLAAAPTVSFHLGAEEVTIDVARADLELGDALMAEALANRIVLEDRPVTIETWTPESAAGQGIAVPDGHRGPLRVIAFADFDRTACGGTHVGRTGEIGPVKIRKLERTRGRTRVTFHCGDRSLADYAWRHETLRALAAGMSAAERDVPALVARAAEERRGLAERVSALERELARARTQALVAEGEPVAGHRLVRVTADSLGMARALAQALAAEERVIVLAGAAAGAEARLVFAASAGVAIDLGKVVSGAAAAMGGRGGGRGAWAEAGGGAPAQLAEALAAGAVRVRELLGG